MMLIGSAIIPVLKFNNMQLLFYSSIKKVPLTLHLPQEEMTFLVANAKREGKKGQGITCCSNLRAHFKLMGHFTRFILDDLMFILLN